VKILTKASTVAKNEEAVLKSERDAFTAE